MSRKIGASILYLTVLVVLLLLSFFAGRMVMNVTDVSAQTDPVPAGPAEPSASPFYCTVNNVAVFESRIHVRCSPADGVIAYFAYPTDLTHSQQASRYLALANSAFALGKHVWVYYDTNSAHNPSGCNTTDCRLLLGLSMVP